MRVMLASTYSYSIDALCVAVSKLLKYSNHYVWCPIIAIGIQNS